MIRKAPERKKDSGLKQNLEQPTAKPRLSQVESTKTSGSAWRMQLTPQTREHPKEITIYMNTPNRKCFVIDLEVKNRPGDLAAISGKLYEAKIEVLSATFSHGVAGKPGSWQFFVEPSDKAMTKEQVKKLMVSCPDVFSCEVGESRDGFLVDPLSFPVLVGAVQRAMIIRNDIWNGMLQKTREKFGSGSDIIIYDQGMMAGRAAGRELLMVLGKEKIDQHVDQIVMMFQALGWGRAKVMNVRTSPIRLVIRLWENPECMGQRSTKPTGHFLRGDIAGVGSEFFGVETSCTETSCIALGDEYCEYLVEEQTSSPKASFLK
jgi:predicted hydrocarbon binding protein